MAWPSPLGLGLTLPDGVSDGGSSRVPPGIWTPGGASAQTSQDAKYLAAAAAAASALAMATPLAPVAVVAAALAAVGGMLAKSSGGVQPGPVADRMAFEGLYPSVAHPTADRGPEGRQRRAATAYRYWQVYNAKEPAVVPVSPAGLARLAKAGLWPPPLAALSPDMFDPGKWDARFPGVDYVSAGDYSYPLGRDYKPTQEDNAAYAAQQESVRAWALRSRKELR